MAPPRRILVFDIGKTNAKAALVDGATLAEIDVLSAPNRVRPGPPYPHADVEGLWRFLVEAARVLHARHGVEAIVPTTHGATAALLDEAGGLALPVLDYEHAGPEETAGKYAALRPPFAVSGSPRLGAGLNLGAQLFWQFARFPAEAARVRAIVTYPQYWAFRLTGVAATEATSLGCHTDLWEPGAGRVSALVEARGWPLAPVRGAAERLGPVSAAVAEATGLDPATPVLCGIHDSNASLLPHLVGREAPFAVVSTGTWVVAMAVGGRAQALDPARDTLVNVSARGEPVPSARFMGGREWALMVGEAPPEPGAAEVVLARGIMLLPSVVGNCGPFPDARHAWSHPEEAMGPGERVAAASFYLAMMTATCLGMIGAEGPVVVEGPFAANRLYLAMLAASCGRPVVAPARGTGTAAGAALLALGGAPAAAAAAVREAPRPDARLAAYHDAWRRRIGAAPA
jgi:sugar (pentulose or hexulose) kinase